MIDSEGPILGKACLRENTLCFVKHLQPCLAVVALREVEEDEPASTGPERQGGGLGGSHMMVSGRQPMIGGTILAFTEKGPDTSKTRPERLRGGLIEKEIREVRSRLAWAFHNQDFGELTRRMRRAGDNDDGGRIRGSLKLADPRSGFPSKRSHP